MHMHIARNIVKRILDVGLADSDFRMKHPHAYRELLDYRLDMEADVLKALGFSETEITKILFPNGRP